MGTGTMARSRLSELKKKRRTKGTRKAVFMWVEPLVLRVVTPALPIDLGGIVWCVWEEATR